MRLLILITGLLIGMVYPFTGYTFDRAEFPYSNPDSLLEVLSGSIADSTRFSALIALGNHYHIDNPRQSNIYALEAKALTEEGKITPTAHMYRLIANNFEHLRLPGEAIPYVKKAIELLKRDKEYDLLARAYNYQALLTYMIGQFSTAMRMFEENLEFSKKHGIQREIVQAWAGMSYIYQASNDTLGQIRTLSAYLEAADTNTEFLEGKTRVSIRLGDIHRENLEDYLTAKGYYKNAISYSTIISDTFLLSTVLLRYAWTNYLLKQYDTSLAYFFKGLNLSKPANLQQNTANAYGNIGTIYRDLKQYDSAIFYYEQSIDVAETVGDMYNLSWLYKDMGDMQAEQGDYKSAYESLLLHTEYNESLQEANYQTALAEARTRFETDRQQQDLDILALKYDRTRIFNFGIASLMLIILVLGFLFIRQNRLKAHRKLSDLHHQISEITQRNLRQQMNPHFIFNTLNSIQYYMFQNDKIATNNYLTKFSSLMRKTLENSQFTTIPLKDELDALQLYLELESIRFKQKFDYRINVDEEIDTLIYRIPTMLVQPYVENAICHGLMHKETEGFVHIDIQLNDGMIKCIIEDNGIGREEALKIKRSNNSKHNSLGTTITESRIKLVNSFFGKNMKVRYTDLKNDQEEAIGTKVEIHLPIMT